MEISERIHGMVDRNNSGTSGGSLAITEDEEEVVTCDLCGNPVDDYAPGCDDCGHDQLCDDCLVDHNCQGDPYDGADD